MSKRPSQPEAWSSDCEAAFHSARAVHEPSAADRARVLGELTQRLAQAPSAPLGSAGESPVLVSGAAARTAAYAKLTKLGLGLFCAATAVVAVMYAVPTTPGAGAPPAAAEGTTSSPAPAPPTAPAWQPPVASPEIVSRRPAPGRSESPKTAKPTSSRHARSHASPTQAGAVVKSPSGSEASAQPGSEAETPDRAPQRSAQQSAPNAAVRVPATPTAKAVAVRPDSPREELAFMARIDAEMRAQKFQSVLALCAEHAQRWPHGTFAQEREALQAIAGCSGGVLSAGTLARAFLSHHPQTTLAPHVRQACEAQLSSIP